MEELKKNNLANTCRVERDLVGEKEVPGDKYYGVQSLRAYENFQITGLTVHDDIIVSLAQIKKASAQANCACGMMEKKIADAIIQACDEIIAGQLHDQFIVDPIQGGAGTSLNMNANEVIANRAIELLGGVKGDYTIVNPNDHVNDGQSTNDVIPTAGKITTLRLLERTRKQLIRLHEALLEKADAFDHVIKMGRTQTQDAIPIRLGQEFRAYACAIGRDIDRFERIKDELRAVNMGGTAIGTTLNADLQYVKTIVPALEAITGLGLKQAENLIDSTQNLDGFVAVSGVVKTCAVSLSKISNDLRLMSSGPYCGLGEINLPPRQNGSSIMPGKVNPVIPEVVSQVAFLVIGHDITITMSAEAGQLELNAFEPVIFYTLFQSIDALGNAVNTLTENCIKGITANEDHCREMVEGSVGIVTALCPYIGYAKSSEIAKEAGRTKKTVREVVLERGILSVEQLDTILNPVTMTEPISIDKNLLKG